MMVVPARNAIPKPARLSMAQAAVMGTAWLTAYRMLFIKSVLRPGQTMLSTTICRIKSVVLRSLGGTDGGMCGWFRWPGTPGWHPHP